MELTSLLLVLAAAFSFLNDKFLKLPTTIGIMLISLVLSLMLILASKFGWQDGVVLAKGIISKVDFYETLMQGMLSFLLFAGALHVNLNDLKQRVWFISIASTLGVILTTAMVGFSAWYVLNLLGINISFIYCLLFGALIAPTDPIAVMGILKTTNTPKSLEIKITGESLFNDGVAVVVFIALLGLANQANTDLDFSAIAFLFAQEAIGGAIFGFIIGWIIYKIICSVDNYSVEILLTLALVMGGHALAHKLHLSGPIAIVIAGLVIGNHGRNFGMSKKTEEHLDLFWELIDEILNAILFVLIGLEVMVIHFENPYLLAGAAMIPVILLARLISVSIPIQLFRKKRKYHSHAIKILTWGGLRGGISVALALSLPPVPAREAIISITYIIVLFSIIVQGLSMRKMIIKYTE